MFLLNSRLGLFTATTFVVPLFPKLRGHFAEFLNKGYPDRLRFLTSPTCVGLRYRHSVSSLAAFLASVNSATSILNFCPHHTLALTARTSLRRLSWCLGGLYHQPALPILLCHCVGQTLTGGTGISTSCPSPTAFALGLGPDLPWVDEPSPGNLRLSTIKILTSFSLLIPAFSLVLRPPFLTVWLRPTTRCSSTPRCNSLIPLFRCAL